MIVDGNYMENCRIVCAVYNLAKKNWTHDDVLDMACALVLGAGRSAPEGAQ